MWTTCLSTEPSRFSETSAFFVKLSSSSLKSTVALPGMSGGEPILP